MLVKVLDACNPFSTPVIDDFHRVMGPDGFSLGHVLFHLNQGDESGYFWDDVNPKFSSPVSQPVGQ